MNTLSLKGATLRTEKLSALRFPRLLMGPLFNLKTRACDEIIPLERNVKFSTPILRVYNKLLFHQGHFNVVAKNWLGNITLDYIPLVAFSAKS